MAKNAIAQGDLLVLIAHSVLANANLGKYKVDACEGFLRVGRIAEGYLWSILLDVDGTCLGNCPLTLGIVVIERNPIDGEHITLREKCQNNARRISASASRDSNRIALFCHCKSSCLDMYLTT